MASESASNIVDLGSSGGSVLTVDMDVTSTASFRGLIIGSDATAKILKKGNGTLRFRSSPKTYSAITQVDEGVLEVTQNAELTNTADVIVRGETSLDADPDQHGTLYITNDSGSNESFTFGSSVEIDVKGGEIEFETTDDEEITLTNGIAFDATDITGVNEAHNNIKAEDDTIVRLTGVLAGSGSLRKTGTGDLVITNASNTLASVELRNGSLELASGASIGGASAGQGRLYIKDEANTRTFVFHDNLTVAWLEASAPAAPAANTGFLAIPSTKTLTVNQTAVLDTNDEDGDLDTAEELKPSYDIALSGSGNFVKDGNGTLKFTNNAKTLTGSVTVAKGVLQVSKNGVISGTGVTVNSGGQLRLSTGVDDLGDIADATYTFGGDIALNSTQRDVSGVITSSGFGHLGGLRFDPEDGIQYAVLTNNIVINSASDIHVNGTEKILFLTGAISGSANLNRTGGGTVVIEGDSSYSGALTLTNGTTSIDFSNAAHSLDASSVTVATGAELGAEAANVGKITGNISVSAGGHLSKGEVLDGLGAVIGYLPVGPLKGAGNLAVAATSGANITAIGVDVTATPVTIDGTVALPDDLVIDLNNAGTFGFYTLIAGGSGSATLNGGSTPVSITAASGKLLNAPSGVTEVELTVSGADIIIELK
ncbi:autotransporter-associated beta strand repeat-containing protein [Verrucomicrobium spinosum]|uniref:autotransporter-associated beta strand repeat-containing protein n=1 Tax=Verrucomicrobium spinosum TaxID=2736 RepID=UPI000946300A|nr:autotransporter-associated beta strand repeat-containing protein [Verrucomicrobium spinosum]